VLRRVDRARHRADVAFTYQPFDERGLDSEVLLSEPQVVVLPAGHPLASRTSLRLAYLEHERLPGWNDDTARADPPNGVSRHIDRDRRTVVDLAQLLELIELGQLTAILPASVATRHPRAQLALRPVVDARPAVLAIAYPQTSRSLAVAAFVRAATTIATEHQTHDTSGPESCEERALELLDRERFACVLRPQRTTGV
jgi:DNA-binding transcriptional LysR family regulator